MAPPKEHTLVVLGSVYGLSLAHYALKLASPKVPGLKVILVTPDTHFYWSWGSPRAIVPGNGFAEKLFVPIAPGFAQYAKDKYEIVQGRAEGLDPDANTVEVGLNGGGKRSIRYDTLVIATGSRAREGMPWKSLGSTEETRAALLKIREQAAAAKSIVVAGGGISGVETVAEFGNLAGSGQKTVTFIVDSHLPLPEPFTEAVRQDTKSRLEKMKIKVLVNSKVETATKDGKGGATLEVVSTDGKKQTINADLYLPSFGLIFNTEWVPKSMLDKNNRVKVKKNLQVEGYKNIFALGDAANLEAPRAILTEGQLHHLGKALPAFLSKGTEVPDVKIGEKFMAALALGKDGGTGQMGTMKMFGFLAWWFKGKTLGLEKLPGFASGEATFQGKIKA